METLSGLDLARIDGMLNIVNSRIGLNMLHSNVSVYEPFENGRIHYVIDIEYRNGNGDTVKVFSSEFILNDGDSLEADKAVDNTIDMLGNVKFNSIGIDTGDLSDKSFNEIEGWKNVEVAKESQELKNNTEESVVE